jgi:cytochrome c-type biogenesis protein CcmH/NrfG
LLGRILEHQRKYKEAIALYQEFLDRFPNAVEAPAVQSFITQLRKQLEEQ